MLPALRIEEPSAQIDPGGDLAVRDHERWNLGNKALTALRGGYIGVLMFGMLGSVAGMSLINPFSVGAGVLLGGKAIVDERRRIVTRRQSEAKAAVRRHVDEVVFQVGKDWRGRCWRPGRAARLRDHYSELADQLNRSIRESAASAERSVQATQAERERRLTEIGKELSALAALRARVGTLLAPADSVVVYQIRPTRPCRCSRLRWAPARLRLTTRAPRGNARPAGGPDWAGDAPRGAVRRMPVPGRRALVLVDPPTGILPRAVPPQPRRRDVPRPDPDPTAGVYGALDDAAQQPRVPAQRTPPEPWPGGGATAGGASPPDRHPGPSEGPSSDGGRRAGRHARRQPDSAG